MAYDKFTILTSSAVPLPIENVDTDQIISSFLTTGVTSLEIGDTMEMDTPRRLVLNDATYSGKILVGKTSVQVPRVNTLLGGLRCSSVLAFDILRVLSCRRFARSVFKDLLMPFSNH
jgi:hypothetical protein